MPARVHKAVGYGMPIDDFYANLLLPVDRNEYLGDELDRLIGHHRNLVYKGSDVTWRVLEKGVLTHDTSPGDLIMQVGDYDDVDHVIMFPSDKTKADWCRFSDTIDHTFTYADLNGDQPPEGRVKYLDFGIPPFQGLRMDSNGVEVKCGPDDSLFDFERDPSLIIGVPDALRWWLIHTGVFSLDGVAKLRPMIAEWWG